MIKNRNKMHNKIHNKMHDNLNINKSILKETKTLKELDKFQKYILYFFIFSFFGWGMEKFYSYIVLGHFTQRGFLFGPICPIYGFGALILIVFLDKYKGKNLKLFFYAGIIFSFFEYLVSYFLDALFAMHWWDYTNDFMNLNGRISIFYSVAWGFIAIVFINYIYPLLKKKINIILSKTPYIVQKYLVIFLTLITAIDAIFSTINYLK